MGWIIEGHVDPSAHDSDAAKDSDSSAKEPRRIILQTPPVDDLVEFEQLSSKLNALNLQRAGLAAVESDAKSREHAVSAQARAAGRKSYDAGVLKSEDRHLKQAENKTKAEEKPLDQQIKELKAKLAIYPNKDYFFLDCFALDLQQDYEKMPVYDYGQVQK